MEKDLMNLDESLFEFAQKDEKITDTKMTTKRIGYFKDAFLRFCRNKSSIVAACIIILLILFAIIVPITSKTTYTETLNDNNKDKYSKLLPKISLFEGTGFWDGTKKEEISETKYQKYLASEKETGKKPVVKVLDTYQKRTNFTDYTTYYEVRTDSYASIGDSIGMMFITVTTDVYEDIVKYQKEHNIQILYPMASAEKITNKLNETAKIKVELSTIQDLLSKKAEIWYYCNSKGVPVKENDEFIPMYLEESEPNNDEDRAIKAFEDQYLVRIDADPGNYAYKSKAGTEGNWKIRVSLYEYFIYLYGEEPSFIFGTDSKGFDIFTRLASGARLSLVLAFFVAIINLIIGAMYGSVSGYFGGKVDLIMERITDVLGNVPFMIVATLFQLHLRQKVGAFPSLLFAFVLTGWIGTASTVRMQFYRYKNQEYVLAARTLGASNGRLMFKHILPNALGTIITSSVLVIPGVIFSESSLTYLGIVNLEGDSMTSVGTMLANGKSYLNTFPHIILFPALFVSLLMITFNLFGNGLRDAFNPSLRGSED